MKKPDISKAMQQLINTVREKIPFESVEANICTGQCNKCSVKVLEFLDSELEGWQYRLKNGETPNFGDINQLGKTSKKVYRILAKNNFVD
ncbi:MAG: hypothetical protein QM504_13820 [Pseudomonadota bacterium]